MGELGEIWASAPAAWPRLAEASYLSTGSCPQRRVPCPEGETVSYRPEHYRVPRAKGQTVFVQPGAVQADNR